MLKLTYTNHYGEVIEFGTDYLYINESDLHDYEWDYTINNKKISNFNNPERKISLTVFACGENRKEIANHLFETVNKDVLENELGYITVGDYRLYGYFVAKSNVRYSSGVVIKMNMTFVATNQWIKTTKYSFYPEDTAVSTSLDYPYDYPHDYMMHRNAQKVINDGYMPCDFEIVFYGVQETPTITINGHDYQVYESLEEGEYLVINSLDKKIYKVLADGTKENVFNKRNKDSYIFEKIAVGKATITRDTDAKLDITLIEQRSEPKWI